MAEITLKLDDPEKAVELLQRAARYAGSDGWNSQASQFASWLAASISVAVKEQVKPAIEEPTKWGSAVLARLHHPSWTLADQVRWLNDGSCWRAEANTYVANWEQLTDVEVLRVGLGLVDEDNAAFNEGVYEGKREMNTQIHVQLVGHLENAIGAERKNAIERMLTAVEELAP